MFIDFNKAFDSLYLGKIWELLTLQGIPINIVLILDKNCSKVRPKYDLIKTEKNTPSNEESDGGW